MSTTPPRAVGASRLARTTLWWAAVALACHSPSPPADAGSRNLRVGVWIHWQTPRQCHFSGDDAMIVCRMEAERVNTSCVRELPCDPHWCSQHVAAMDRVHRELHPSDYHAKFIAEGVHARDGRSIAKCRPTSLSTGPHACAAAADAATAAVPRPAWPNDVLESFLVHAASILHDCLHRCCRLGEWLVLWPYWPYHDRDRHQV